jgi:hypothetical protein
VGICSLVGMNTVRAVDQHVRRVTGLIGVDAAGAQQAMLDRLCA